MQAVFLNNKTCERVHPVRIRKDKGLNPNHHCPYMELKFRIICFPTIPIKCRKPFLIYYFLFRLDWILV